MTDPPLESHPGTDAPVASEDQDLEHALVAKPGPDGARPAQPRAGNGTPSEHQPDLTERAARCQVGISLEESDDASDDFRGQDEASNSGGEDPNWDSSSADSSVALSPEELKAQEVRREEIRKGKAKEVISSDPGSPSQPAVNANPSEVSAESRPESDSGAPAEFSGGRVLLTNPACPLGEGEEEGTVQLSVPGPSAEPPPLRPVTDVEELGENQGAFFIPWERDPERPIQKLPIRFRDCLGRTFLFPWEKARTWKVRAHLRRIPLLVPFERFIGIPPSGADLALD